MLLFRFLCAILMAWAINVALARTEAEPLVSQAPELLFIGPLAGAAVGFINLAKRQGWGVIVAIANGVWAGILTLASSLVLYLGIVEVASNYTIIEDYGDFARIFSDAAEPLVEILLDLPLITVIIIATAVVGVLTEILHWCLVRLLRGKMSSES